MVVVACGFCGMVVSSIGVSLRPTLSSYPSLTNDNGPRFRAYVSRLLRLGYVHTPRAKEGEAKKQEGNRTIDRPDRIQSKATWRLLASFVFLISNLSRTDFVPTINDAPKASFLFAGVLGLFLLLVPHSLSPFTSLGRPVDTHTISFLYASLPKHRLGWSYLFLECLPCVCVCVCVCLCFSIDFLEPLFPPLHLSRSPAPSKGKAFVVWMRSNYSNRAFGCRIVHASVHASRCLF